MTKPLETWVMLQGPPAYMAMPDLTKVPKTTIEIRSSVSSKDIHFSLIFIAGTQGRIVEADDTLIDNLYGFKKILIDLISKEKTKAYYEVDRLGCSDCIYIRKLNEQKILLQIYEPGYAEDDTVDRQSNDQPPLMYIEAIVGFKKFIWELYTAYRKLPKLSSKLQKLYGFQNKDYYIIPEIETWLENNQIPFNEYCPDDIYSDDALDTPWARV
jgi:hypothetical protein